MNTKNIILAILMVLSFAACSSEIEGIDNNMTDANVNGNSETSLSVRMVSNGINTKADNDVNEFAIDSYMIAVFDSKSGERIGFKKEASSFTDETVTIDNISTKEGKADVVVIANLDQHNNDWTLFDNLYTYNEFVDQTVGCVPGLVKVGISKGVTLSGSASTVTVELKQLTARVVVNLSAKAEGAGSNTVVKMVATRYDAKIARDSKIIPEINAHVDGAARYDGGVSSFWYCTTNTEAANIDVNVVITIDKGDGSTPKEVKKTISVPFLSNGQPVTVLENGVSYNIEVEAKISVKYEVELSYQLHAINTITQDEITFN